MLRHRRLWLGLFFACGCGGPSTNFTGIYSGVVTEATTCGTSSPTNTLFQLTMTLVEDHDAVTDMDPSCPGITGQAQQNVVTVSPFVCPATVDRNGNTDIITFSSGKWTLNEDATQVDVSLQGSLNVETPEGATTTCSTIWTGLLALEKQN